MDTSITVAVIIGVLFVFTLPTFLRRTDAAVKRADIDRVPETAQECQDVPRASCSRPADAPRLFAAPRDAENFMPPPVLATAAQPPVIRLERSSPVFEIIDGDAEPAEASHESVRELPVAVGQGSGTTITAHSDQMDIHMHSSQLPRAESPVLHAPGRAAQSPRAHAQSAAAAAMAGGEAQRRASLPAQAPSASGTLRAGSATDSVTTRRASKAPLRSTSAVPARSGAGASGAEAARGAVPSGAAQIRSTLQPEQRSEVTEQIQRLRRIIPVISSGLLLAVAAAFITAVFAAFGVLTWAVAGLMTVLAVGALFMVRSLNLRVRALRKQIAQPVRTSQRPGGSAQATSERSASSRQPAPAPAADRPLASGQSRTAGQSRTVGQLGDSNRRVDIEAIRAAFSQSAVSREEASGSEDAGGPHGAAEASTSASDATTSASDSSTGASAVSVDESDDSELVATTEVPVLLAHDGPAHGAAEPRTDDSATAEHAAGESTTADSAATEFPAVESAVPESTAAEPAATSRPLITVDRSQQGPSLSLGRPAVRSAETAAPAEDTAASSASAPVTDPLTRRFAATGWTPAPLPTPTYVDAPVVERIPAAPSEPDASSFRLAPQTKENLAEMFAAELGYRPELADASRDAQAEEGPLHHGRTAIGAVRAGLALSTSRVDDVLARRRA